MTLEQINRRLAAIAAGHITPTVVEPLKVNAVVWSGKDELLPPRAEHPDGRFSLMPALEWDTPVADAQRPRRAYNKTGKYAKANLADEIRIHCERVLNGEPDNGRDAEEPDLPGNGVGRTDRGVTGVEQDPD